MKQFAAASVLVAYANAFWGKGHLLVARRAQEILEQSNPAALAAALEVLAPLKENYPSLTTDENEHPFTECAQFADNIKLTGYAWQSNWHFINLPWYNEGGDPSQYKFRETGEDIVQCLTALTGMLTDSGDYQNTTYYQHIAASFPDPADQRSFALRLVIHYLGDIHQPLHSIVEVNSKYTNGDEGGNTEKVPDDGEGDGIANLHGVWDSVIYQYPGYPVMPFDADEWDWYTQTAAQIAQNALLTDEDLKDGDFAAWALESYNLAVEYVYPGFTDGTIPTADYEAIAKTVIEHNMAIGGARLAALIESIYGQNNLFLQ